MILAISSSPREGNTLFLANSLMSEIKKISNIETKVVSLVDKKITICDACDSCWDNNGLCKIEDDINTILDDMKQAKAIILATPVYFQGISSYLKILLDRSNSLAATEALRNKIGFAMAVGSMRNGGQEYALSQIVNFFLAQKMLVASGTLGENKIGLKGWSKSPEDLGGIKNDDLAIKALQDLAKRIIEVIGLNSR